MPIEQLNGFSQILTTFNFQQEEAPFKENATNPELLPAQEDSIQLSIQAQKALNQKQPDARQATEIASQPETTMQIDAQGNLVRISPEGAELAASQTSKVAWETSSVEAPKNIVGTATLDSGTKVSIYTTDFEEGEEKPFFDAPDKKVMAEITRADGSTETLAIRANTVINEDAEGKLTVISAPELRGSNGNDVIINIDGVGTIDCGNGNDLIISLNRVEAVNLGSGSNKYYAIGSAETGSIVAGDGGNHIELDSQNGQVEIIVGDGSNTIHSHSQINLSAGDGHNRVTVEAEGNAFLESSLALGNGDNSIHLKGKYSCANNLRVGEGNNSIKIDGFITSSLTVGNGDNSISITDSIPWSDPVRGIPLGADSPWRQDSKSGDVIYNGMVMGVPNDSGLLSLRDVKINIGNGNNAINAFILYGQVRIGDGDNIVTAFNTMMPSTIKFGNGDNRFDSRYICSSSLGFGNGSNTINTEVLTGTAIFGDGNNHVNANGVSWAHIETGDGNNDFNFGSLYYSTLRGGDGNDVLNVTYKPDLQAVNLSYVNLGKGENTINIQGNVYRLTLIADNGDDVITIDGEVQFSHLELGSDEASGRDRLSIYKNVYNSSILSRSIHDEIDVRGMLIDSMVHKER